MVRTTVRLQRLANFSYSR